MDYKKLIQELHNEIEADYNEAIKNSLPSNFQDSLNNYDTTTELNSISRFENKEIITYIIFKYLHRNKEHEHTQELIKYIYNELYKKSDNKTATKG